MHGRFRAGMRAWIDAMTAAPIEYTLLDLAPDIPDDPAPFAAAFVLLAWSLSNNWESEALRAEIDRRLGREVTDRLLPVAPAARGQGSNDWVVAGSKTASGAPLLANDPHLLVSQPGAWLELHLRAPGYEARGVSLPFSPGIILGATPHHAWGVTNVSGDVQDLYEERLDVAGTAALHDDAGSRSPCTARRSPSAASPRPRVLEVRESRHGPIVTHGVAGILHTRSRELDATYALRWTGHDGTIEPSLALDVANATDVAAFRRAVLRIASPGQNFVYADVDGSIAHQSTGMHPIRRAGDGTRPVPGWDDDHEWIGWIPPEEMPFQVDPERGFIATANNDIQPPGYPYLIGKDFHRPVPPPADRAVARGTRRSRRRVDAADPGRHDVGGGRIDAPAPRRPRAARRTSDGGARDPADVGRRHAGVVAARRAVQRLERRDRAPGAGPETGRGTVRRVPRIARDLPMRGAPRPPARARRPGSTTTSFGRRSTTRSTRRRAPPGASSTRC